MTTPATVLAHSGHGEHFQAGSEATEAAGSIQVDAQTAKRIGIKVEPVNRQRLAVGIKTTGQIETLPNQKVEVTSPLSQATVVELLVEPGAFVKAGQRVAVLAAPDLVELRVESQEKRAEGEADLQQAQADLKLAQQNLERQQQIAAANIEQARTELKVAQEQYDRDRDLVSAGALPRREMLESQAHLAEGKAQLTASASRQEVLEAQAQLKRARSAVEVAQTRIRLSNATYQARLQQLGTKANAKGLVTVTAPISGRIADREATLGQSFEDAGGKLMTIVNDRRVFAIANIYEKDLDKINPGQQVSVKIASQQDSTFSGRITTIGSIVEGETRVVPVKAEVDNSSRALKPGMFAEMEVLTTQTPKAVLAIPSSAVVEANGKQVVYIQNGNAFQPAEVTLGQVSGDTIEVKSGLFEGDLVVTQRAPQLYAQSLRVGSNPKAAEEKKQAPPQTATKAKTNIPMSWWLIGAVGGAGIAGPAFMAGTLWSNRRTGQQATSAVGADNHPGDRVSLTDFRAGMPSVNESSQARSKK
jgi:cobalt-zinc-cadmium efflux system membrane fusion protein